MPNDVVAARNAFIQKMATPPTRVAAQNPNTPVFTQEGPPVYAKATQRNQQFAKPGSELTKLTDPQEAAFRQWVAQHNVPFDPNEATPDYDMRGYWLANPNATHAQGQHFPDTYKTVRDSTFSDQSKYALPGTPFVWQGNKLVDKRTGQLVFK